LDYLVRASCFRLLLLPMLGNRGRPLYSDMAAVDAPLSHASLSPSSALIFGLVTPVCILHLPLFLPHALQDPLNQCSLHVLFSGK
jgi:hypothetical protein